MKRISICLLLAMVLALVLGLNSPATNVSASPVSQQASTWCGNGTEADNFGFKYDLKQPHWTVGNGLVSEETMTQVDVTLDKLNSDQLAQTMILVLPEKEVGQPVNCAVHFLRYMKLGLVDGPHKDNGFVWLFIQKSDSVEVRYGVGMGLPGLTAPSLGDLKRVGVDTYASSKSMDSAVLEVVKQYDAYVRSEITTTGAAAPAQPETAPAATNDGAGAGVLIVIIGFIVIASLGFLAFAFFVSLLGRRSSSNTNTTPDHVVLHHIDSTPTYTYPTTSEPVHHSEPSQSESSHISTPTYRPTTSSPSFSRPSSSFSRPSSSFSRPSSSSSSRGGSGSGNSARGG